MRLSIVDIRTSFRNGHNVSGSETKIQQVVDCKEESFIKERHLLVLFQIRVVVSP